MRRLSLKNTPDPLLKDAYFAWVGTTLGPFCLLAGEQGIRALWMMGPPAQAGDAHDLAHHQALLDQAPSSVRSLLIEASAQIKDYFAQKRESFNLPLDPQGTPFQMKVWAALRTIPYGQAISYKELAEKVNSPQAFRAVGNANGKNPIALLIPCHRVIAADGQLGGFSSGLERKRELLKLEKVNIKPGN